MGGEAKQFFRLSFLQHNNLLEETAPVKVTNEVLNASDEGLISVLVLLNFNVTQFIILLQRMEHKTGIKGSALSWFKADSINRYQYAHVNEESSRYDKVSQGVPQDSVLGTILFTPYLLTVDNTIRKQSINFHCYADDTQLYWSLKPDEMHQLAKLKACPKDIILLIIFRLRHSTGNPELLCREHFF